MTTNDKIEQLREMREKAKLGGGTERIARQHERAPQDGYAAGIVRQRFQPQRLGQRNRDDVRRLPGAFEFDERTDRRRGGRSATSWVTCGRCRF